VEFLLYYTGALWVVTPSSKRWKGLCVVGICGPERVVRWSYGERGHMVMQGGAELIDTFLTHSNILPNRRQIK
jgi:hypothetical protein